MIETAWKPVSGAAFTHVVVYDDTVYSRLRRLWRWMRGQHEVLWLWEIDA